MAEIGIGSWQVDFRFRAAERGCAVQPVLDGLLEAIAVLPDPEFSPMPVQQMVGRIEVNRFIVLCAGVFLGGIFGVEIMVSQAARQR